MLVEMRKTTNGGNYIDRIIKHGDCGSAQSGILGAQVVEFHECFFTMVFIKDWYGGSSRDTGEGGISSVAHSTAVLLDEFLEGGGHGLFDYHGVLDMSRDTKEFGSTVVLVSKPRESFGRDGLDVGDSGRTAEKTDPRRNRRLETGFPLPPLQTLNQGHLLSKNIRPRPTMQKYVKIIAGPTGNPPNQPRCIRLMNRLIHHLCITGRR